MSWSEVEFQQLYSIPSKNGLTRPSKVRGSGYKFINMGELFSYDRLGNIEMERVTLSDEELETNLVDEGDLLFARQSLVLAGAGKCSFVERPSEPTTFESHIIRVRLNKNVADPRFYFYYFRAPQCRIKSIVTQGVQAGIRGSDLKQLLVHQPPVSTQKAIADVLWAYDDLIINSRRRITLIEDAARQLYHEWFVRLRFPGHEETKIVDGVPDGWTQGCIGDLANLQNGFAFKSSDWQSEGVPVIKIGNITSAGLNISKCDCVGENIADGAGRFEIKPGELLIAMTGATVGKVGIMPLTELKHLLNQRVGVFKSRIEFDPAPFLFTFFNSLEGKSQITNFAGGAAQPNISGTQIEGIKLLLPPEDLLTKYVGVCGVLFRQRLLLERQCELARQARDLLLPRLMSGEMTK